jgi:hypothetical protein
LVAIGYYWLLLEVGVSSKVYAGVSWCRLKLKQAESGMYEWSWSFVCLSFLFIRCYCILFLYMSSLIIKTI